MLIRKTICISKLRTSVTLEPAFWTYLEQIADHRRITMSALVTKAAQSRLGRDSLAATLRLFCLAHARRQIRVLDQHLEEMTFVRDHQQLLEELADGRLPSDVHALDLAGSSSTRTKR